MTSETEQDGGGRTGVFLTEHLRQIDSVLDALLPRCRLESKRRARAFGDRRELEKVAGHDQLGMCERGASQDAFGDSGLGALPKQRPHLNAAERFFDGFRARFWTEFACDVLELVEQLGVHHGHCTREHGEHPVQPVPRHGRTSVTTSYELTLINDQDLDALPLGLGRLIPQDIADKLIRCPEAEADPGERVNRGSADVARGHAGRSRDGDGVSTPSVLALQRTDDFAQEDRFARP